jgi:hypothetical protein
MFRILLVIATFVLSVSVFGEVSADRPPNIVLILADDKQITTAVKCVESVPKFSRGLAAQGMRYFLNSARFLSVS